MTINAPRIGIQAAIPITGVIANEGVSLDWGDAYFRPATADELLAARQDHDGVRLLWLCNDRAEYGTFEVLEEFLVGEKISFRHKSDAKDEYDAMIIEYRPEIGRQCYTSDKCGRPLILLETITSIAAAVDQAANTAEGQTALELLRRLRHLQQFVHERTPVVMPPLEPFEIVG